MHDGPATHLKDSDSPTARHEAESLVSDVMRPLSGEQQGVPAMTAGILDSVVVGVMQFSTDGRVTYANAYARGMLRIADKEIGDLVLSDFHPRTIWPDGSSIRFEDYPAVVCLRTGKPQGPATIGFRDDNGETKWVTASVVPTFDASARVQGVIATFVDITDLKQAEESLRQSDERYLRLVEETPDAIVIHRGGEIRFINDAGIALWGGASRADFIGQPVLDLVHPRHREAARRRIRAIESGITAPLADQRPLRRDGRPIRVEVIGMPCVYEGKPSIQAIFRNVTERRRAERRVRRQREILRKFFDRIPLLVAIFAPSGRIKMCNRQWQRVVGWGTELTLDELLQRCYPDAEARERVARLTAEGKPGWIETRMMVSDGRTLDILGAVIRLSDGTMIGMAQDITARKQAETALRQHKAELEQRVTARTAELTQKNAELESEIAVRRSAEAQLHEKQETLEQLLDTHERHRQLVAYEIHDTFVQDVIGALMYLDLYRDHQGDTQSAELANIDKAQLLLREAVQSARRTISGLRPPIIDEQGVAAAIEYLVSELNAEGMEIRLEQALPRERLPPVFEAAVFRVVQEALTNVQRHSGTKRADVTLKQSGDRLELQVRDFGAGFDPERVGSGHFGLRGMAERVRLLNGTVEIESSPGKGTEIRVVAPLPTHVAAEADSAATAANLG
ncbi:MAG: PAS domain S-box protein [Pirellulales bacterium]